MILPVLFPIPVAIDVNIKLQSNAFVILLKLICIVYKVLQILFPHINLELCLHFHYNPICDDTRDLLAIN